MTDFPFNEHFKEDDILTLREKNDDGKYFIIIPRLGSSEIERNIIFTEDDFNKYPKVFGKLPWHENRRLIDLPDFWFNGDKTLADTRCRSVTDVIANRSYEGKPIHELGLINQRKAAWLWILSNYPDCEPAAETDFK